MWSRVLTHVVELTSRYPGHVVESVDHVVEQVSRYLGHVVEGAVEMRVDVPRGVVVARDVQQQRSKFWSRAACPVVGTHSTDRVRRHLLDTDATV